MALFLRRHIRGEGLARARTLGLRGAACALAGCAVLVLGGLLGVGCAQQPKVDESTGFVDGSVSAPIILSGQPRRDAAAYEASRTQLMGVKYGVLDEMGPKPIWERWGMDRPPKSDHQTDSPAEQPPSPLAPALATAPATMPAQIDDLPGDQIRIVWILRNYGGSKVTAATDGNTARRKISLEPPDLVPLVAVVTQHLGDGGVVTPLPRENTLVITCPRAKRDAVLDLLNRLDVAARQIEITARIFEVSQDFDFQQGAELLLNRIAANDSQQLSSVFSTRRALETPAGQPFQGSVVSLMRVFQDAGLTVEASVQLLADEGLIRIVSEPRMTVAVGQTGYMLAGQELPITSTLVNGNVVQTAVTYKPVGVQLYITPQAVGPDSVKLHTISVVSSVSGFTTLPRLTGHNAPLVNPIIDSREAETAVTIDNGHTLVISGLRMIRTTTRENKIPGLGDLPVLGWLFKNHRSQQQLTDLYFFVTPTLL